MPWRKTVAHIEGLILALVGAAGHPDGGPLTYSQRSTERQGSRWRPGRYVPVGNVVVCMPTQEAPTAATPKPTVDDGTRVGARWSSAQAYAGFPPIFIARGRRSPMSNC
jgi:hypothetical protein